MSPGVRNVVVPLGSLVLSFVVVTAAGFIASTPLPSPSPPTSAQASAPPTTAPPEPADLVNIKLEFEQKDGAAPNAAAALESMTLDVSTTRKAGEIEVCVTQPTGPWRLDEQWVRDSSGPYCQWFPQGKSPLVVKLVQL